MPRDRVVLSPKSVYFEDEVQPKREGDCFRGGNTKEVVHLRTYIMRAIRAFGIDVIIHVKGITNPDERSETETVLQHY